MLVSSILKQLIAAQQLQLCSAVGAAAAVATSTHGKLLLHNQQRSVQTAAEQQEAAAASTQAPSTSSSAQIEQQWDEQQQASAPSRALPPPSTYGLKITIKAHELLMVKLASTAIRDLILVNMAPKSKDVLPDWLRNEGAGVPWVNLVSYNPALSHTMAHFCSYCC